MNPVAGAEHDYAHVFHAGNVGDVLKHVVLAALLEHAAARGPVTYVDTHAGEGLYTLRTTGEWTEGIFRLWREHGLAGPGIDPLLRVCRALSPRADRPEKYPGSPFLAARLLGPDARLECFETHPDAHRALAGHFLHDPRFTVHASDGFSGLAGAAARADGRRLVVLCDPPYVAREDWTRTTDAVTALLAARPDALALLWYPIKSWSRPHVLQRALREAGVAGTTLDLITLPLEEKRNRLNGSGLFLANAPDALVDALAAPLHALGRLCAIRHGRWSLHVESWRPPAA
jgi:23S rRNA (adenine2030-N6)-methyltransferase